MCLTRCPTICMLGRRMTPSDLRRYAIAVAAVAVSLLARYAFQGVLGDKLPFLQFFPAVVVASWLGGLGPGLVATALSSVAAMFYLLAPDGLAVADPGDRLSLIVFAGIGALIAWLNHRVRRPAHRGCRVLGPSGAARRRPQHDHRRRDRDRRQGAHRGVQPRRRAAVRVSRRRGGGAQRERTDAIAASRGARRLSAALSHDRRGEDHRPRP